MKLYLGHVVYLDAAPNQFIYQWKKLMTSLVVEATYENGMLKLDRPLPLGEHERVRIIVQAGITLAEQTAGLMGWKGPEELAEYFAMDPEPDFPSPGEG